MIDFITLFLGVLISSFYSECSTKLSKGLRDTFPDIFKDCIEELIKDRYWEREISQLNEEEIQQLIKKVLEEVLKKYNIEFQQFSSEINTISKETLRITLQNSLNIQKTVLTLQELEHKHLLPQHELIQKTLTFLTENNLEQARIELEFFKILYTVFSSINRQLRLLSEDVGFIKNSLKKEEHYQQVIPQEYISFEEYFNHLPEPKQQLLKKHRNIFIPEFYALTNLNAVIFWGGVDVFTVFETLALEPVPLTFDEIEILATLKQGFTEFAKAFTSAGVPVEKHQEVEEEFIPITLITPNNNHYILVCSRKFQSDTHIQYTFGLTLIFKNPPPALTKGENISYRNNLYFCLEVLAQFFQNEIIQPEIKKKNFYLSVLYRIADNFLGTSLRSKFRFSDIYEERIIQISQQNKWDNDELFQMLREYIENSPDGFWYHDIEMSTILRHIPVNREYLLIILATFIQYGALQLGKIKLLEKKENQAIRTIELERQLFLIVNEEKKKIIATKIV